MVRLDAAEFGFGGIEHDGVDAEFGEQLREVGARFADELVGKEIAVADDDAEDAAGFIHVGMESSHVRDRGTGDKP
jgi:hypothetical protein